MAFLFLLQILNLPLGSPTQPDFDGMSRPGYGCRDHGEPMELSSRRNPISGFKIWSILPAVSAQTFYMDMNENLGCCYLMGSNRLITGSSPPVAKAKFPIALKGIGHLVYKSLGSKMDMEAISVFQ